MATEYKMVNGLEALEREFEQLIKKARPTGGSRPGFFSSQPKPAQLSPTVIDYTDKSEHDVHALISVRVEKGEPSIRYCDVGEKPKVSPEGVQELAQKFIEACRRTDDWHHYFSDKRALDLRAFAEWTAASVNERPVDPPLVKPKATADERYADGREFVEAAKVEPTLTSTAGRVLKGG